MLAIFQSRPGFILVTTVLISVAGAGYTIYHKLIHPACEAGRDVVANADAAIGVARPRIYRDPQFWGFTDAKETADALSKGGCCDASERSELGEKYWIVVASLNKDAREYFYSMRVWRCGEVSDIGTSVTPIEPVPSLPAVRRPNSAMNE